MEIIYDILAHYDWSGLTLMAMLFVLFCVQSCYWMGAFRRISSYRLSRRRKHLAAEPPVSVVVPLFGEDYEYVERRLPRLLSQEYATFEVVVVYIGHDSDFYDDLRRMHDIYPALSTTRIDFSPRFPISIKTALNIGIKSAAYEHVVLSSADAAPVSERWLSLMGRGFMRGDIVLAYSGIERTKGLGNRLVRTYRLYDSMFWLSRAVRGRAYRGSRHALGITKSLYFGVNGFNHLNLNCGEDDLFLQSIVRGDNVSVVLSPRSVVRDKCWGGVRGWMRDMRRRGVTYGFYPRSVRNFVDAEPLSRILFFASAAAAAAVMPAEIKIAVAVLVLLRYATVIWRVSRLARRTGESGIVSSYVLHDMFSPFVTWLIRLTAKKQNSLEWR